MSKFMLATALLASTLATSAQSLRPDQVAFRGLYKELVETNTTLSVGSCTDAAAKMAVRLKAAGYTDSDITLFSVADHPKEGGLVAILPGTDAKAKPMLLLAHIDVVEAKREDWTRDPFTLIEEGGYFYARGASDDKAQAAIWTDAMIRLKADKTKLRRTVKLALTCGEETTHAFNGADWLGKNRRALIDAEFALNEGGGGQLDASGKQVVLSMQVGEKTVQNYRMEVTNRGGHSSRPVKPNAIYQLAAGITKVADYEFPVHLNATTTPFFTRLSTVVGGEMGAAMKALVANPNDAAADAIVSRDPSFHSMLRTTCVATLLSAGHANNALPQRATANINCRIAPGETVEGTRATLEKTFNDAAVKITVEQPEAVIPSATPLTPAILGPAEALAKKMFPGITVLPTMSTGATDGRYLAIVGIPTYGIPGIFVDPDLGNIHGLNERIGVKALYDGRDYMFELAKLYANAK